MPLIHTLSRYRGVCHGLLAAAALCGLSGCEQHSADDGKIHFGVSAPLTGDTAEYANLWREGFEIALEEINGRGGVGGRSVVLDWQDSQGDPKQAVNIAQKFVDDPRILAELGDFASPSSMAASPVYQRGGVVQYGFTNSHPKFTASGDYMFSAAQSQETLARNLLKLTERHGRQAALLYVNNDWGKTSANIFLDEAGQRGVQVPIAENFIDSTTDFRPLLLKVRDAGVQVLVIQAYYKSAALIVQQARQIGLDQVKVVWGNYNKEFIELAGKAAEGVSIGMDFYAPDAGPLAEDFVKRFRARYGKYPDSFNVSAYDALTQLAWAAEQSQRPDRKSIREALDAGQQIPSVLYGPFAFNDMRRVEPVNRVRELVVRQGEYVPVEPLADKPKG